MNDVNDSSGRMPELEANSAQLTQLLEQARADIPSGKQWSQLSLSITQIWDGTPGSDGETSGSAPELDAPIPLPPGGGAEVGVGASKLAAQTGLLSSAAFKVAGVATLAGALATGVWGLGPDPAQSPRTPVNSAQSPPVAAGLPSAPARAEPQPLPASGPDEPSSDAVEERPRVNAVSSKTPPKVRPSTASQELSLLSRAREQLQKNPRESLALCRKHEQLYPHGQLAQEREVLLIDALQRLRREEEAAQKRDEFGKAFPDSPHQSRVKRSEP
jgi:hypothetical protein